AVREADLNLQFPSGSDIKGISRGANIIPRTMPPQTRSSTRPSRVATRSSATQAQPSRKSEAPKKTPKPVQKRAKAKPVAKAKVEQDAEPARKRVRRSGTKDHAQSGEVLQTIRLMNLPVEVLIEVARYVHPLDLIMLARVNKFFRELLMDKRSALIWRSSRGNMPELPPCPDEVSEPQYAAMIFAKRCSTCGGYAPREMNPILMIRLCSYCWVEELVDANRVTDRSLLSVIGAPVPGQSRSWKPWCLYNEARAVKLKLDELTEAGDEEALQQWKAERHKLVEAKRKNAVPLERWLVKREQERARDRNDLKVTHKKEIESRLIKLGWVQGDFLCYDRWRRKQWNSMLLSTKALTDKVWDNLLPRLLGHLELNRDERLARECSRRRGARQNAIYKWFETTRNHQPSFARTMSTGDANRPGVLRPAFPALSEAYEWPEYIALIENDVPHEQFLVDFEERKPEFQQSITDWRHELEARLIAMLPDDTHLPNFDPSPFTMTAGVGKSVKPLDALPEDTQKLLRADAIFTTSPLNNRSVLYFYPHSFRWSTIDTTKLIHYSKAQEFAQVLLRDLDIPNASYLGLKALGRVFRCGRCPQAIVGNCAWEDIINHYLETFSSWKTATQQRQVRSNKNFVYIDTHDVNSEIPDRPLVRMSAQETASGHTLAWTQSHCLVCQGVGIYGGVHSQAIMDHLRDVHLVEEPEAGVHYRP
ncbi:unnamed protein product, partial [Rhizoctonia solani]